uniref:ATP-dependent DNA helicase n=1 Tax=Cacopsylla melanoneura TaxID=428564 RepID=A0A8D9B4Y9_9HEMI
MDLPISGLLLSPYYAVTLLLLIIEITSNMSILLTGLDDLILHVFPDLSMIHQKSPEWLCERAILTSKNDNALSINESMLAEVPGEEVIYESINLITIITPLTAS